MSTSMTSSYDLAAILRHFQVEGALVSARPHGSGHIHDSFRVELNQSGQTARYLLQRINPHIFKNPVALMENIQRVTAHLAAQLVGEPDAHRRVLTLIPARSGLAWHVDQEGVHWRIYRFIEGAHTRDVVETPRQAYEAARAFGHFQQRLTTLPTPRLHETIPKFHHTPCRFQAFESALTADSAHRVRFARQEIAFALARQPITSVLIDANLPERVTHNDTKFNNVMLDDRTGQGLCVVDLDTVMPGLAMYDFGDMVRTATCAASEDERDLTQVAMQFPFFEALARGYLSTAGSFLTEAEKSLLAFSGKLIAFEQGIRFLTDHLAGDPYYKIARPDHNLDRCRTQFKLVASIEDQEDAMQRLVDSIS